MNSAKGRKDEIAAVTADELRSQLILKKMVGKGGFAAVYVGTYKGHEVAVKVILAEHTSPESLQVKLLLREGQYMSRCTHKHIVKCHAVCQLPADFPGIEALGHRSSTWALVLEYIGGGSLAALLMKQMSQTRKAYTDFEAYCWVLGVAEALSYLHSAPRPVMHRDVKADNVLLAVDETGRPTAKLMDFGLMAALDGKNPLLRRRSVTPGAGSGGGGEALGRASAASISRASVGGGRNLSAPSVATFYNDTSHEPGKIFYLMDELPAPTVAALAGPAASRRVSLDFGSWNNATADSSVAGAPGAGAATSSLTVVTAATAAGGAGGGGPATSVADGPFIPAGSAGLTSPATHFGFTTVASRGSSFDGIGAIGGIHTGAASGPAGSGGSGSGLSPWSASKGTRSGGGGLSSAGPGSFGTLVPLNEEASYHGNTAGYAAMLLQQQQQRKQLQQQRREVTAAVATATPAVAAGAAAGGGGGGSSQSSSLHGTITAAAATRPGCGSGSGPCSGSSPTNRPASPLGNGSPEPGAQWQGDAVAAGAVRVRLVSEEGGAARGSAPAGGGGAGGEADGCGGGGGDAAIALAAASRLGLRVSERSGSLVRMSAPQPSQAVPLPPSAPVALQEGDSDPDCDCDPNEDVVVGVTPPGAGSAAPGPWRLSASELATDPHLLRTPNMRQQQQCAARPYSANHLPPIIAVAKSSAGGGGVGGGSATAIDIVPRQASFGSAGVGARGSPSAGPRAHPHLHHNYHLNGHGGGSAAARSSCDAVPAVNVESGLHSAAAAVDGRRSRASSLPSFVSGLPPPSSPPLAVTPLMDRQSSQKSLGSNRSRSGTGNGYVHCGEGGAAGGGACGGGPPAAAAAASGGSMAVGGGGGGGQFSIAALLQGRYEQDFQWVWRLTGQTGSCMYMAPEVHRNMPYNEKVDVFSFGVLMYEVFSRTLLLISALNLRELRLKGMDTPEGYAQYVAEGYRPPRPLAMPEPLYELIAACWADDPCARPNMAEVVETLRLLQETYAAHPATSPPSCGCVIS